MKRYKNTKYLITEEGKVWSEYRDRFLKTSLHHSGYEKAHLNKSTNIYVHRLVAETYLENPNNLPCINHIDGNKLNNNVSNLEWCTQSYNLKHAYKLGLINTHGEKNSNAKLTKNEVLEIRRLREENCLKIRELSEKYKVTESAIKGIIYHSNWEINKEI